MKTESISIAPELKLEDCWNGIGVQGNRTCEKLKQHIHCRNCPVYSSAAEFILHRHAPDNYIDEATRHYSQPAVIKAKDIRSVLLFRIGSEWLALPTRYFDEIAEFHTIHSLPHLRDSIILGVASIRGELLICASLAEMLGIESHSVSRQQREMVSQKRLLVMKFEEQRFVFPVDAVYGTYRFSDGQLSDVPVTVAKSTATYTKAMLAWQDTLVGCLDEQLLFYSLNRRLG